LPKEHLDSIINHPLKKTQLLEKKKHTLYYVKTFKIAGRIFPEHL